MNDRGMKKWRPFNSVVPNKELLKKNETLKLPSLSIDEINEYEELLLNSLYTHSEVEITYYEKNQIKVVKDYVLHLDSIKKNVHLRTCVINFRQIYKVR